MKPTNGMTRYSCCGSVWSLGGVALRTLFTSALILLCSFCGCGSERSSDRTAERPAENTESPTRSRTESPFAIDLAADLENVGQGPLETKIRLQDVAIELGISHGYENGASGRVLIHETIGAGVGWLDYDNDGRWDLFANQGGDATVETSNTPPLDSLFQNVGSGFRSVAESTRIVEGNYSQGVAVADFDNDGFDDLYITNLGENTLWHNCGDGTFQEMGRVAGVADPLWSTSAAWGDLDHDGDLDLYVCNYIDFDPRHPLACTDARGQPALCNIASFAPTPDACYMNHGDGTFVNEASTRGLFGPGNRALGVAICDFNRDGWTDIYVANDTTPNFLFVNRGLAQFEDQAPLLGCAVDRIGATQGSMGLAIGDFDRNGYQDIYCTNFYEESNTLYANDGPSGFRDVTGIVGLHSATLGLLGFGTVMQDFDGDGQLDLLVANGHVDHAPANQGNFQMIPQLFVQHGSRWQSVGPAAGEYFKKKFIGRGVATADFDGDGDLDIAILNQSQPLSLLRNDSQVVNYLCTSFVGRHSNRRGIGCRVTVHNGEATVTQELCGGTSYASSHQPTLYFGLGEWSEVDKVVVEWPSGVSQTFSPVTINQELKCVEPLE